MNTAFGGTEILIPESWHVFINAKAFFGGIKDERKSESKLQNPTHRLIINGSVVFGGVEIKRG